MQQRILEHDHRVLYFNGVILPQAMLYLDQFSLIDSGALKEHEKLWLWKFPICHDACKRDNVDIVLSNIHRLNAFIKDNMAFVRSMGEDIQQGYGDHFVEELTKGIAIIIERAPDKRMCEWIIRGKYYDRDREK